MNKHDQYKGQPMHLQVMLPTEVLVDQPVIKVIAQAVNGTFCLLPRHIDFVSALVPGILCFCNEAGDEEFAAINEGILVKCGREVMISTLDGVRGGDLRELNALVEERFVKLDEHERKARTALARLEAATLRGFRELQEKRRE